MEYYFTEPILKYRTRFQLENIQAYYTYVDAYFVLLNLKHLDVEPRFLNDEASLFYRKQLSGKSIKSILDSSVSLEDLDFAVDEDGYLIVKHVFQIPNPRYDSYLIELEKRERIAKACKEQLSESADILMSYVDKWELNE